MRDTRGNRPLPTTMALLLLSGLVLAYLATAGGCSSSTEPEPVKPPYTFLPMGGQAVVYLGGHREFQVAGSGLDAVDVVWIRSGVPDGTGPRYRFRSTELVDEDLRVEVTAGSRTWSHDWQVDVAPGANQLVHFAPLDPNPLAFENIPVEFSVSSTWGEITAVWSFKDAQVGSGPDYTLVAEGTGPNTLAVAVALGDTVVEHVWYLNVRPFEQALPGVLADLSEAPGDERGHIRLSWTTPPSLSPLTHFEMRVDTEGPVSAASWEELPALPIEDHQQGETDYSVIIPSHLTGFVGGETVWCAVRAHNELGFLSPVVNVQTVVLDGRWWVSGTVRGLGGVPLAGVDVSTDARTHGTTTDASGAYTAGPFEVNDRPVIMAWTPLTAPEGDSWYAELSDTMATDLPRSHDFLLLPRYGCDPRCTGFDGNFIAFMRNLTGTLHPTEDRPNTRLYRWESFPVTVHVPEFTSDDGIAYGTACRSMVDAWNDNLGEEYLTVVADSMAAQINFVYDLDAAGLFGLAVLDAPHSFLLGETIPEHVTLRLRDYLPNELAVQAVALHELGHALGIVSHAFCSEPGYLMDIGGINPYERPPAESIHEDEIRLMHTIRALPQGTEMIYYPTIEP
ncbi:MAG: hypothetical protein GY838_02385 [bacterium]|nr:hypothetical protein [bacterium]